MPRLQQAKASGSSESEQAVEDRGARLEDAEVGLMHKVVRDHQARGRLGSGNHVSISLRTLSKSS